MARAITADFKIGRNQPYDHSSIEAKWQTRWEADGLYRAEPDPSRAKYYALVMFPYTSGDLHIGHWWNFAIADVHVRYKRMLGLNVLFPPGFDAFGLPAEDAAIRRGIHPYTWTAENIRRMERQWRTMGGSYDWTKELATFQPEYYRWNQWFFLQLFKKGLAYKQEAPVNWCPNHQVLANEQVRDGRCWRCEAPVVKRNLAQWFFRITDYADELLDFSRIDWPDRIRVMQENWIGRSEGVEFRLPVADYDEVSIAVFTTRVDTVFGMTYVVLAPEHPLVDKLTAPESRELVAAYVEQTRQQTEIERLSTDREKSGVPIGSFAINPATGERVPIWIADYVLASYGTGAIMAVPASDERDWEFARKFHLPIRVVVRPRDAPDAISADELPENRAFVNEGIMVNSGQFNGLDSTTARDGVAEWFEQRGVGKRRVNYRLRDWLISRQRYWGTPIPLIYCPEHGAVPVPDDELPVVLPENIEFGSAAGNPLDSSEQFVNTTCPICTAPAKRETDTMDTFMDSSWYFLRYTNPRHDSAPGFDPGDVAYWLPVDQYMGGAEHAVMHLLYSRFFIKVLRDLGLIQFGEPFKRLFNQGVVLGPDGFRMSKSRGNVVNPDEHVARSGADAVRGWLMFLGPWDQGGPINTSALGAVEDLLHHVWDLVSGHRPAPESGAADRELRRHVHGATKGVTQDLESFRFNTVVSKLMTLRKELRRLREGAQVGRIAWDEAMETLVLLCAPSFPHLAEELWTAALGKPYSVHSQQWPKFDEAMLVQDVVTLVVQVNGKVRDQFGVPLAAVEDEAQVRDWALALPRVQRFTADHQIRRVIYIQGKLVNIVVS